VIVKATFFVPKIYKLQQLLLIAFSSVLQLDFEIFTTIASFIKISSGHSFIIKQIFTKFFRTI